MRQQLTAALLEPLSAESLDGGNTSLYCFFRSNELRRKNMGSSTSDRWLAGLDDIPFQPRYSRERAAAWPLHCVEVNVGAGGP